MTTTAPANDAHEDRTHDGDDRPKRAHGRWFKTRVVLGIIIAIAVVVAIIEFAVHDADRARPNGSVTLVTRPTASMA